MRCTRPEDGAGARAPSLGDRLPNHLLDAPPDPGPDLSPFTSLYQLEDEWAAAMANRTVHTVMHLSWVWDGAGGYRGQMAVLVDPNGLLDAAYTTAIKAFQRLFVCPACPNWDGDR